MTTMVRPLMAVATVAGRLLGSLLPERIRLHIQMQELLASGLFDLQWYVRNNPDVVQEGYDPVKHWATVGWKEGRKPNLVFDTEWYLAQNPDARKSGLNPLTHYIAIGAAKGRDPNPLFSARWYLEEHPSVQQAGKDPMLHYLLEGADLGYDPTPLFDSDWYLAQNPDVAASGVNPLWHFISRGGAEGRDPNPLFDSDWYLEQHPEVASAGWNPLVHYVERGVSEGFDPNPFFDSDWYLSEYPDVSRRGVNPLTDFLVEGARKGRDPHPLFETSWYVSAYPDAETSGLNPLHHYLLRGQYEGRLTCLPKNLTYLPLAGDKIQNPEGKSVAVIAHIFFADLAREILHFLNSIPVPYSLYVSTDNAYKQRQIREQFAGRLLAVKDIDIRVTPNRGRNLGPLLIEFGGKALEYDYVCHIHGKRSGLITYGSAWRHQLFYGLLGNEDIVRSIFTMFAEEEKVGVIFPLPYRDVLPEYQWGSNKEATVELLMKLGVDVSVINDQPLEFPAGSMFWFRPRGAPDSPLFKALMGRFSAGTNRSRWHLGARRRALSMLRSEAQCDTKACRRWRFHPRKVTA